LGPEVADADYVYDYNVLGAPKDDGAVKAEWKACSEHAWCATTLLGLFGLGVGVYTALEKDVNDASYTSLLDME